MVKKTKQVIRELIQLEFKAAFKTLMCKCECWEHVRGSSGGGR